MNFVVDLLLAFLIFLAFVPVSTVFIQVLFSLAVKNSECPCEEKRSRLAVLVPAHNEEEIISATLHSILAQLNKEDRLMVVADNCSDETGKVAASLGADVVIRSSSNERGKGFALDFGVNALKEFSPEVLVIVDADCIIEEGCLDQLVRCVNRNNRPAQALYLMRNKEKPTLKMQFAEFAWIIKNWLRPLGYKNLGLPCQLMGTGMALPWNIVSKAKLKSGHIVEDMQLGVDLAIDGHPAVFCPQARVNSEFPADKTAERSQRTRWEHGHLSVIISSLPRLLKSGIKNRRIDIVALALDLAVPPLTMVVMFLFLVFGLELFLVSTGLTSFSNKTIVISVSVALLLITIMIAWLKEGRKIIPFIYLFLVPLYILRKIPIYIKFFIDRQKAWVRTGRKP